MISVITGASSGVGAAAALDLAQKGYQLVLVGRDRERLESTASRVRSVADSEVTVEVSDFARLADVRDLASRIRAKYDRIDVLANNAGVMVPDRRMTADGHELMIQVNHLSPFLLTNILLDRVGRVVTTSSRAAKTARLDPDDLSRERRRWNGWLQYGETKQANALFTVALAARGSKATCFHPGVIKTSFAGGTLFMKLVTLPGLHEPVEKAAARLTHLATSEDGEKLAGTYFRDNRPDKVPARMKDPDLAERLWKVSAEAVGLESKP
ncbi:SDR family NAD(P)-dependent oxidoreductase [Herbidospora sp. NBRC 101105]|uniref:SDR family NAD(P)-dependent oxidoreductase n=1 Tax=Herbidospora sp. NBRC 101105 TaxID=3032195 RepID=UPI0024A2006E|nr:SDR family NAD(P)-dependent oxidoreductase [Herbidospora sp. NBRC 101105]GLX96430.1 retinol dehydrogenase [Herbidospora sp. NBRC 101105]